MASTASTARRRRVGDRAPREAAELPRLAMKRGATTVEINLEDTPVSDLYQHRLRGKASEMLA